MASPANLEGVITGPARPGPVARALSSVIRAYQSATASRPSPCRYIPTCSSYALEAIDHRGPARGAWLTARRLCRCHPWGGSGFDPVPD